ncbi:MAG: DUF6600 domain-containing protein [Ramlibacter sp.]|nr:DUF6600 domain-containing protein [Ramlibacter sp.]
MNNTSILIRRLAARLVPLLAFAFAGAIAQDQGDPPARVGTLSQIEGTVAFAPAGETEWADAFVNRPITTGDRLWTEKGARAEVHLGSAVLHVDGTTFMDMTALDGDVMQAQLNEGTVNARVRQLQNGENFEVDTPQLAFRASRPGDYRIDVDPVQQTTRITVRSGVATVYGAAGQAQQLEGAQVVTFTGQDLERVAVQATPLNDGFDRWAADRNRAEDQSVAARHVPREVVGYQQLDAHGSWAQDATYGEVWYPRVAVADWAPYRYGRWEFISPWGWTWIDDAPWGFAPFHYGRWAMIDTRWAWVPGRIGPRPVYAPALVAFVGGGAGWSLSVGGPGIGWFPLGPGEAWRPYYRTSTIYATRVNRYVGFHRHVEGYAYQRHVGAVTAVRMDDFNRGRSVNNHWHRVTPTDLGRAQVVARPSMPEPRRFLEGNRPARVQAAPQLSGPAVALRPPRAFPGQGQVQSERPRAVVTPREDTRSPQPRQVDAQRPRIDPRADDQQQRWPHTRQEDPRRRDDQRAQEDPRRAQDDQRRAQVQAQQERGQREQQERNDRGRRDQQVQQERVQRQQQVQAQQREQAVRHQQEQSARQQEQATRQQERFQRQQQQAAQAAQEQGQRQQHLQQQQWQQQQRMAREQPHPPQAAPVQQPRQQESRERGDRGERGERGGRGGQDQREDRRSQAGDEGERGGGRGGRGRS